MHNKSKQEQWGVLIYLHSTACIIISGYVEAVCGSHFHFNMHLEVHVLTLAKYILEYHNLGVTEDTLLRVSEYGSTERHPGCRALTGMNVTGMLVYMDVLKL